jgi:hypothetical protein
LARFTPVNDLWPQLVERLGLERSSRAVQQALDLQAMLAEMRENGCRAASIEVSSHALDQGRTEGVNFAGGIFTNLGRDHLDYHENLAAYESAKGKLFEGLEAAIARRPPSATRPRRLDGSAEARLVQLACSAPPEGYAKWTMQLLADRLVQLEIVAEIGHETVRKTLKKMSFSRGA